jgi:hypothetical protein
MISACICIFKPNVVGVGQFLGIDGILTSVLILHNSCNSHKR